MVFKETSAEKFYGVATIYFYLIDVLHLSDQFLQSIRSTK